MIYIANRKSKIENIRKKYPYAYILDVSSKSNIPEAQKLSPFYPHYNIPIPFTDNLTATCVEAVWQGLKVFENNDVDFATLKNDTMKDIKRTVRKFGKPLGHRKGVYGKELLDYFDARMQIYLPTYKWVLDNIEEVRSFVMRIKEYSNTHDIVLLDYNTNVDVYNIKKAISHAGLLKLYIEDKYPVYTEGNFPEISYNENIEETKVTKKKKVAKSSKRGRNKKTKNDNSTSQLELPL